jgi:hypothetical protein
MKESEFDRAANALRKAVIDSGMLYGYGSVPIAPSYSMQTDKNVPINCKNCGANEYKLNKCLYCGTQY